MPTRRVGNTFRKDEKDERAPWISKADYSQFARRDGGAYPPLGRE